MSKTVGGEDHRPWARRSKSVLGRTSQTVGETIIDLGQKYHSLC